MKISQTAAAQSRLTLLALAGCLLSPVLHAAPKVKTVFTFSYVGDGGAPEELVSAGDLLYGVANLGGGRGLGDIFSFDPVHHTERVLVNFGLGKVGGGNPLTIDAWGRKLFVSNLLHTIYAYGTVSGKGRTLYNWNSDGAGDDYSGQLTKVGPYLYGNVVIEGEGGTGAHLFQLDIKTRTVKLLFTFTGGPEGGAPNGRVIYRDGVLYGAIAVLNGQQTGGVYSYDLKTGAEKIVYALDGTDGAQGVGLTDCGAVFIGAANQGGTNGTGTLFSFDPATGKHRTLHNFGSGAVAKYPRSAPICRNGLLYGVSDFGAYGYGAIYKLSLQTGKETLLHSFNGADGAYPGFSLVSVGRAFYGTTAEVIVNGQETAAGTIYKLDP